MEETKKCIEIYITKKDGATEETIEFKNVVEDTPENAEWFKSASDIMKQVAYVLYKLHETDIVAYVLYKLHETDIEESEVTYEDD